MSTFKLDNIVWRSGELAANSQYSITADKIMWGTAKAWVNFTTITASTVQRSFNHSSITRNGVGDTTLGLSISFPDAYFCATGMGHRSTGSLNYDPNPVLVSSTISTYNVRTHDYNSDSACDSAVVCIAINR